MQTQSRRLTTAACASYVVRAYRTLNPQQEVSARTNPPMQGVKRLMKSSSCISNRHHQQDITMYRPFLLLTILSFITRSAAFSSMDRRWVETSHHPHRTTATMSPRASAQQPQQRRHPTTILFVSEKETTWDRITGPKLFKTVTNWQGIHSVPLVPLRILTGLLMIHHGSEGGVGPANVGTPEFQGFIDYIVTPYFGFLPGSPVLWSAVHDYIEFFGGILLAIGFLTRPAALALLSTMLGAVYFHAASTGFQGFPLGHVPNYSYDFEEPTLYALIFLLFWFNGAGPLSVDSIIYNSISQEDDES